MPINKETILSVYDDKLTLVQWLKKVEDALKNDTLQSVSFVQGENQIALKFTFESSEITTDFVNNFSIKDLNAVSVTTENVTTDALLVNGNAQVNGELNAVSVTTKQVNADNISVDGDINSNGSISASDAIKCDDLVGHNTISSMERIIDANDNFRFIEGNITLNTITGITQTYGKWSLSGTHLMIVVAGNIANGTQLNAGTLAVFNNLPSWVYNKIVPLIGTLSVEQKNIVVYADDYSTQTFTAILQKLTENRLQIYNLSLTASKDRTFRIVFDLLIDAD